ncbi:MAG: hypothetical protein ACP6IP_00320 [Candidatus Njordarchaeia archaeon]
MTVIIEPNIAITSSRRPSQYTNTFMKALSMVFNAPIIRRGSSSIDDILIIIRKHGIPGLLVVYSRMGNPSVIDFYSSQGSYYYLYGRVFLTGVNINRRARGEFKYILLEQKGQTAGSIELYHFLLGYFKDMMISDIPSQHNLAKFKIVDIAVTPKVKKLLRKDSKFKPAKIEIWNSDKEEKELLLGIKVHHTWKSQQQ